MVTRVTLTTKKNSGSKRETNSGVIVVPIDDVVTPGMSLTQRAYVEIKRRVITLGFRPGQFLTEAEICRLLGMGRTPVHQALHLLKLEGLVEIIPRKGILIRPDSLNDVIALLEARMIVEPACMALAAARVEPHHLAALKMALSDARCAIDQGDGQAFMELDTRFHGQLVQAAGNSTLTEVMRLLHERARRLWYLQLWGSNDFELTQQEHESLFYAVERGDPSAASNAAQVHLSSLKRRILVSAQ